MSATQITSQIDPFFKVILVLALVALVVFVFRASQGQRTFFILTVILLLFGSAIFVASPRKVPVAEISVSQVAQAAPRTSTEEMWDQLTAARIKLDDNAEAASETEAKPATRPEWVDTATTRVGSDVGVVVSSEPFSTVDECYAQLEHSFLIEAWSRLKTVAPENQKDLLAKAPVDELGLPLDYIMREICQEEYTETVDSSVGEMKRVYVLMKFTPHSEAHLLSIWQAQQRDVRLGFVGKIAALILASLFGMYGLLQVDTMTRGYYTRRLIAGASAVIIAIAAALFVR